MLSARLVMISNNILTITINQFRGIQLFLKVLSRYIVCVVKFLQKKVILIYA